MPENKSLPRITMVDALRGFALAGVVLVHMVEQYIAGATPEGLMNAINGVADQVVLGLVQLLFVGKFFALFSILFGLSFSIQMESAARRGEDFSSRFLWRAALLLLIGYLHHLFYRGDILTIYALLTPLLIPFHRLSNRWLLIVAGLCFLGVPRFIMFSIIGGGSLFGLPPGMFGPREAAYFAIIESGTLWEVFRVNMVYGMQIVLDYQIQISGRLYYTFAYFLVGLWLGKIGLFRDPVSKLPAIIRSLKWSALAWVFAVALAIAAFATAPQPFDFSQWQHILAFHLVDWANLLLTSVIGCGFLLLYQKQRWQERLGVFAPYGRMALSNYLLQSLIGTFLLYGWGLGLVGQVRTLYLGVLAICLITLQALVSKYWLRRFRYGPVEWLWRSGTYMKFQPFRR